MRKNIFLSFLLYCFLPVSLYAQKTAEGSLLWRISGPGLDKPSYLFGTIHLPQKKFVEFADSVYYAIIQTNAFYGELNYSPGYALLYTDKALMDFLIDKSRYIDSISKTEKWKALIRRINKTKNLSLDPDDKDAWINYSMNSLGEIFEQEPGVDIPDVMLAGFADAMGKKIGGLETALLQMQMLYKILDAKLEDTTVSIDDEAVLTARMRGYYLAEDTDSLAYLLGIIDTTIRKLMFDNRNAGMANSIEKLAKNEAAFFAIGCGHLPGEKGVIQLLRKKGFTLTPVRSGKKTSILFINDIINQLKGGQYEGGKEDILEPPPPQEELIRIEAVPQTSPTPPPKRKGK